jgi:hypothetical protein
MAKQTTNAAPEVEEYGMEGFEESAITLQTLPILALAQSQTPEVVEGEIEGLKAGVLMNNTTKLPLGAEIELIAYKLWPGRTKFPPRGDNGPIECFSPDNICGRTYGKCAECAFRDFNLKDKCQDQRFFVVAPAENPDEMYRLIFAKSNYKVGRTLENTLKSECQKNKLPIYGVKFKLSTKRLKNEASNSYYFVFEVKPVGLVDREHFPALSSNFKLVTELRKSSLDEFYANLNEGQSVDAEFGALQDAGDAATTEQVESNGDALL